MIVVRHLMNLLLSELQVQDDLLGLLIQERVAIAKQSQEEMDRVLEERNSLERKLDKLIQRRENLLRALESEMKFEQGQLALENLSLIEQGELGMIGESLASAFDTIHEMREQNRMLRRQTLFAA